MTTKLAVAIGFLSLNFYTYHYFASEPVIPARTSFDQFPVELGSWSCAEREIVSADVLENLGATDHLICDYASSQFATPANLYIGYHATQIREEGGGSRENSIHPPAHCLPGSGWDIIAAETVQLPFDGLPQSPATAQRLVIAKGQARRLVYYWYQSRGRVIAQDWKKILYVGWDRATRRRTDGSLLRFTMPIERGDQQPAERAFRDLAPRVAALLPDYVPE